jgi:cytoskeleton protein RodZ
LTDTALGVGRVLAEARQAQGLAIADVAQQLKFMPRQLEALEQERFQSLPGPTIARGMVRTYARFLKVDPDPLLERMAGHVDTRDATPQLAARFSQPVPFADSGRRSTALYLFLSAGVLAIAGAVVYEWRHERAGPELVAAAKTVPAPVRAQSTQTASAAPVSSIVFPPEPAAALASPPPVAKDAASAEPKMIDAHRIVFRFDGEAWIEVTDGAGRLLASSLNQAGTQRVLQGKPPFSLVIGNASHVKLSYNERDVDLQPHVKVEVARLTLK